MARQDGTTKTGGERAAPDLWWGIAMAIAMDELDLAFLAPADAPLWQPLESDEKFRLGAPGDSVWSEVALEIEQGLVWAEVVALLEGERWREAFR